MPSKNNTLIAAAASANVLCQNGFLKTPFARGKENILLEFLKMYFINTSLKYTCICTNTSKKYITKYITNMSREIYCMPLYRAASKLRGSLRLLFLHSFYSGSISACHKISPKCIISRQNKQISPLKTITFEAINSFGNVE